MSEDRRALTVVIDDAWPERVVDLWADLQPRVVVVPGGRTAVPLFSALRAASSKLRIDSTEFLFSDERCVPPSHRDSNFGLAHRLLFRYVNATVHRMPSESCRPDLYASVVGRRRIDLAILGVGEDGHTASLFNGSPGADAAGPDAPLVEVTERPDHRRLTLTPRALNASSVVAFIASGKEKAHAVSLFARGDPSIVAAAIRGVEATYLFCDPDAGAALTS